MNKYPSLDGRPLVFQATAVPPIPFLKSSDNKNCDDQNDEDDEEEEDENTPAFEAASSPFDDEQPPSPPSYTSTPQPSSSASFADGGDTAPLRQRLWSSEGYVSLVKQPPTSLPPPLPAATMATSKAAVAAKPHAAREKPLPPIRFRRPDIEATLIDFAQGNKETAAVLVCGPPALSSAVRNAIVEHDLPLQMVAVNFEI